MVLSLNSVLLSQTNIVSFGGNDEFHNIKAQTNISRQLACP